MLSFCFVFFFGLLYLTTVTWQCAPHKPARAWTNVNNHYDNHYKNYHYYNNHTYATKLVEIEKRIGVIEKLNPTPPPLPNKPAVQVSPSPKTLPIGKKENEKKPVVPETPKIPEVEETLEEKSEKSCTSCLTPPKRAESLKNSEGLQNIEISPPLKYYSCIAVNVRCSSESRALKISDEQEVVIEDPEEKIIINCVKGIWMYTESEGKDGVVVDTLSCLL